MRKNLLRRNCETYFDNLKHFIRQSFQGWELSLLISVCVAGFILVGIFVFGKDSVKEIGSKENPKDNMAYILNLIPPAQLGIAQWQIGDYATYRYRRRSTPGAVLERYFGPDVMKERWSSRDVNFHIIAELTKSEQRHHWMRITGLSFYRNIPKDIYRLVSHSDLRITPDTPRYDFVRNYIPKRFNVYQQVATPMATLVKPEEVSLETPAGKFECIHYRVKVGANLTPVEIWTNPNILPLGIVRVSTPNEVLELASYGRDTEFNIPELIHPVIEGISTLERGCSSCHGSPCHIFISPPL